MTGLTTILYAIENEIHRRGQGYVYLRTLGIEPPPFWDRQSATELSQGVTGPRL